jgi:NMD protein affecting ribosome stability and mRNA decay
MALNLKPGTPKCERCGIPTCTRANIMCDDCAAHDAAVAEKIAAGWTGEDK